MLKLRFPAITPLRLVYVAIAVSLVAPFAWGIWWVPISKTIPPVFGGNPALHLGNLAPRPLSRWVRRGDVRDV